MNQTLSTSPSTRPRTPTIPPDRPDLRPLVLFAVVALGVGGPLLALSTRIEPGAPFILAAVLAGLAYPPSSSPTATPAGTVCALCCATASACPAPGGGCR